MKTKKIDLIRKKSNDSNTPLDYWSDPSLSRKLNIKYEVWISSTDAWKSDVKYGGIIKIYCDPKEPPFWKCGRFFKSINLHFSKGIFWSYGFRVESRISIHPRNPLFRYSIWFFKATKVCSCSRVKFRFWRSTSGSVSLPGYGPGVISILGWNITILVFYETQKLNYKLHGRITRDQSFCFYRRERKIWFSTVIIRGGRSFTRLYCCLRLFGDRLCNILLHHW